MNSARGTVHQLPGWDWPASAALPKMTAFWGIEQEIAGGRDFEPALLPPVEGISHHSHIVATTWLHVKRLIELDHVATNRLRCGRWQSPRRNGVPEARRTTLSGCALRANRS